ncbi:DUF1995 family protein [Argonema galeatum]|uniref:DUF1995 family protein n=1 Tax=Argonema galeatum TaxID=2942762 RepID=UPI0020134124|nr:DUF1995 family protein [Argonema galeatum]MCL1467931.1 DUF1995 family protein [Argonema galeatum A003/A1]
MAELPQSLEEAIAQSREATLAAIANGCSRLQVELNFPEIALQAQSIAQQFIPVFEDRISHLKVFFPDAGAAALARRDWGEVPFKIQDIGMGRTPIQNKIEPEDEVFLLVDLSAVEVGEVEKLCNAAGSRPVILLIPHLEDAATVGIGYTARQLRERLLNTLESCYYVKPVEGAALFRCYPSPWQVWLQNSENYNLIAELPKKPVGDELDRILFNATQPNSANAGDAPRPKKPGLFTNMERFLRALSR